MNLAIATCRTLPEVDVDESITLEAFRSRGHSAKLVPWEDGPEAFAAFDATIVRSTWNYPLMVKEFEAWIRATAEVTRLLNPADTMLWNLDKRYLNDLQERGLPVVPSQWFFPHVAEEALQSFSKRYVVKPTVGAGSLDARSFLPEETDAAISWLSSVDPTREFMVQPFMESVDSVGEQSIVVIGGEPSHRIRKCPRFADGHEQVEGPLPVTQEFDDLARRAIAPYRDTMLYGRVDMMMDSNEDWIVSELELIEPSLFFRQNPAALTNLVDRVEFLSR